MDNTVVRERPLLERSHGEATVGAEGGAPWMVSRAVS